MSFINPKEKEINCKIAYYGPAFSGKTTTIRCAYEKTSPKKRGPLTTLSEGGHDDLFFDFLPLTLGTVKEYKVRFHLYTVPGQVIYDNSRTILLKGIDGIIFVADSQISRIDDNLESWKNLQINLKNHNINFATLPMALQLNKRDLPNVMPAAALRELFEPRQLPVFESVATKGKNVMECFNSVAKWVLQELAK